MPHSASLYPAVTVVADDLAAMRGGRLVFEGVHFRLGAGGLLALRGPNGAGKSTLLRLIAGLLPAAGGRLAVTGGDEARRLHYFGHSDGLKPALSLRETLCFWSAVYAPEAPRAAADLAAAAARVGLGHALDLPVGVLSAGQRRRAGLARLLLAPRPLWLLDEPSAALDRQGETLLGALMREHLEAGGAIVAATHLDLPVAGQALELGGAA